MIVCLHSSIIANLSRAIVFCYNVKWYYLFII
nr:MAG TPA: hypothetical protein [Caudoviricetes sp.]